MAKTSKVNEGSPSGLRVEAGNFPEPPFLGSIRETPQREPFLTLLMALLKGILLRGMDPDSNKLDLLPYSD